MTTYVRKVTDIEGLLRQLPKATDDAGLSRFKAGTGAYSFLLGHFTTNGLTADEIHGIGLAEMARIEAVRPQLSYSDTEGGREQIQPLTEILVVRCWQGALGNNGSDRQTILCLAGRLSRESN